MCNAPYKSKEYLLALLSSNYTQGDIAACCEVHQGTISKWMLRLGISLGQGRNIRPAQGPGCGSWKGEDASYSALHKRVKAVRGKPRFCEHCKTTTAKRYEWASLSKKYDDLNDYIRLCTSCHRKHDGHSRGPKSGRWKGGPPKYTCGHCSNAFRRHHPEGKPPLFCNAHCYHEHQRNKNANTVR